MEPKEKQVRNMRNRPLKSFCIKIFWKLSVWHFFLHASVNFWHQRMQMKWWFRSTSVNISRNYFTKTFVKL